MIGQELAFPWCSLSMQVLNDCVDDIVEKLQFSLFQISCSQGILNASWLSWRKHQDFYYKFVQICLDLGKNVPSDAPFTLNEQLSTSSIE